MSEWDKEAMTGGRFTPPDGHSDNRGPTRNNFRPMSQTEQDEEEMQDWVDGNARWYVQPCSHPSQWSPYR